MRFTGLGPGHVHLFSDNPFGIDVQANLERQAGEDADILSSIVMPNQEDLESEEGLESNASEAGPESEDELLL